MNQKFRTVERQRPLHCPPPNRCTFTTDNGKWASRPWAKGEKEAYVKANFVTEYVQVPV